MREQKVKKTVATTLINALNAFAGIQAHEAYDENGRKLKSDMCCVHLNVDDTSDGRSALKFLAWIINQIMRGKGNQVLLLPQSVAPYLCNPGLELQWIIECGKSMAAGTLAKYINSARKYVYVAPDEVSSHHVPDETIYDMRLWAERVLNKSIDGRQFAKAVNAMQSAGREQSAAIRNISRLVNSARKQFTPNKIARLLTETADRYELTRISNDA